MIDNINNACALGTSIVLVVPAITFNFSSSLSSLLNYVMR